MYNYFFNVIGITHKEIHIVTDYQKTIVELD